LHTISASEATAAADALLEEAIAGKRWTIPPGAIIQMSVGPFTHAEVWENNEEVTFVWRTADGEYAVFHLESLNQDVKGQPAGSTLKRHFRIAPSRRMSDKTRQLGEKQPSYPRQLARTIHEAHQARRHCGLDKRVRSLPALLAAKHRGRVWEPAQGSHQNRLARLASRSGGQSVNELPSETRSS
jgi:hypothetical protein